ncbi:DMT family transporter [Paraliobacillus sp. JSM ZJ581]|uniref:DMT family transporter n=1 Tax=Paraliobacillus sp. JSM ZJ581 TaxID=3342118 RepID=UPI0035A88407
MRKISNLGATVALVARSVYGVNSVVVKAAHNKGVTTFDLLIYQFVFALLWFSVRYLIFKKKNKAITGNSKSFITNPYNWLAAITTVLTGLFYYSSIQLTDPSIASLGLFQYPWILLILGVILNKEIIFTKNVLAVLLIWVGTILLIGGTTENITVAGLIYGISAGASFATYLFSLQKISDHPITKLFIFFVATILVGIVCIFRIEELTVFTKDALIYGLITAILGQVLTFELMAYAAKKISSAVMGTLTTTELPVAMILTWTIWGPLPNLVKIVGLLLMLFSILWLKYEQSNEEIKSN